MIPATVAHLWQSTVFAGAAWLAALALRRNRAQNRYWVWFTASAKFLFPFSLLVRFGTVMPHRTTAPMTGPPWLGTATEFSRSLTLSPPAVDLHGPAGIAVSNYLLPALLALWACGAAAVLICWLLRWRRVRALLKSARPVSVRSAWEIRVPIMSTPGLVEPGVIGVLRPVLLIPEGIAQRLSPAQMEAILAHELCHVGRRDNLTAAIHMAVQAIFWFHPLTWWIGARLVEEREQACDEEVLGRGCSPRAYAESILEICKSYHSAPLACVSGVTGSDLKSRIDGIMRKRSRLSLSRGKKLVLGSMALASIGTPVIVGILNAPAIRAQDAIDWQAKAGGRMAFEVASVKLNTGESIPPSFPLNAWDAFRPTGGRFTAAFPVSVYIEFAYKLWPNEEQSREFSHLPKWVTADRYRIDARAATGTPTKDQMRLMMQSLLAERFHLVAHFEAREVSVFELRLAKAGQQGPKLVPHDEGPSCDKPGPSPAPGLAGFPPACGSPAVIRWSGNLLAGSRDVTMATLARSLFPLDLGRPVIDKTGLKGSYDFTIQWTPEQMGSADSASPAPSTPSLGTTPMEALRDQLGLKLEPGKASLPVLVIDKLERPSEN